ncbi:TIGR04222 domain-containing membrane protein [Amycolatopsis sp. NPDC059657]|uniref:TIGR04222 domain-containing membrane protein n=1 Tax=Amycolatopsis sp. NPDC059657 TaxID=3346899 RepID=UPI00366BB97D
MAGWTYLALLILPALAGAGCVLLLGAKHACRLPTLYHFAYLAGGTARVAETVVAAMIEREQLRVSDTGRLFCTPVAVVHPLEHAVVAATVSPKGVTAAGIRLLLANSAPMRAISAELEALGLVTPERLRRRVWWAVCAVYAIVLALGIAGWKWPLLLPLVAAAMAGAALLAKERTQPRPTLAGLKSYETARGDRSAVDGAAGLVAVGGLRRYPDPKLAKALQATSK